MAKYLKKFENETEYNSYIGGSPILPNVSLIGTTDVRYNPLPISEAGDIVYYNGSTLKFCKPTDWSSSLGTAVAVVVVPNTHTPDGTVRCIAVTGVNPDGTSTSTDQGIVWSNDYVDTPLPNLDQVPYYDNTVGGTINVQEYSYLSSNNTEGDFGGPVDCLDGNLRYSYDADGDQYFIPNPYLPDGSPNPDFRDTSIVINNACADFNGASNTSVLVGLGTEYSAANACHLYSTEGISTGNWYLPACGELAYIMPRFMQIQNALDTVGGVQLDTGNDYWSSSEFSSNYARSVGTADGRVSSNNKTNASCVRPFCSLSPFFGF